MPTKPKAVKESQTPYRAKRKRTSKPPAPEIDLRWADIEKATQPIVLKKDGKPVAVVIKYTDYQPQAERRNTTWQELDTLLAKVQARTRGAAIEEIETDITAARQEVREQRNARRGG